MRYLPPVYRPPSEANSLILQITYGCSHNQCTFCAMYKDKPFKIRPLVDVKADIAKLISTGYQPKRIFLADGDALIMPYTQLCELLILLKASFDKCERISTYASPKSLLLKTPEELQHLKALGLDLLYVGVESGSDTVLTAVQKGCSADDMLLALKKAKSAGFSLSTMIISGLGGQTHWQSHAIESAKLLSKAQPDYISLLTLMLEPGTPLSHAQRRGDFKTLTAIGVLEETRLFLEHLDVSQGVFRSNHASNYLNLAGDLPKDKEVLMQKLQTFLEQGGHLKPEALRGL